MIGMIILDYILSFSCYSSSNMKVLLVILLVVIVNVITEGKRLPSYVKKCKRHDPELNECMREAFIAVQSRSKMGNKSFRIPPMNLYVVPYAQVSLAWMNATLTDMKFYNLEDMKITSFQIDLGNNPGVTVSLVDAHEELKFHYDIQGNLLQFPLQGAGEAEASFYDMEFNFKVEGKIIEKNGKEYLKLEKPTLKIRKLNIKHVYLHNLFQDNPELTDRVNRLLLENIETYAEGAEPIFEKLLLNFFEKPFRGTFDNYSLDELFD